MNTKNIIIIIAAVLTLNLELGTLNCFGQNIGINTTGNPADLSAGLDVDFTNKGLLIPQVALTSSADASTISSPATSLLVYCTGSGGLTPAGYYYNSGTPALPNWVQLITSQSSNGSCPTDITNELDASGNPCVGTACGTTRTLQNCINACDALVYNGYNDWEVPIFEHLLKLLPIASGNSSANYLWTTNVFSTSTIENVRFSDLDHRDFSTGTTDVLYCRCVR